MYKLLFLGVSCLLNSVNMERTLNYTIDPQCYLGSRPGLGQELGPEPGPCETYGNSPGFWNNLVYTISKDGSNQDSTDFRIFWSSIGGPTFLISSAPPNTTEDIPLLNWLGFLEDHFPEIPFFNLWNRRYVALVVNKLIEFDDVNDTADLDQATNVTVHDLSESAWYPVMLNKTSDGSLLAVFTGKYGEFSQNITLELRAHTIDSRADNPPRMLVQPSSISLRIILDNQTVQWAHSRFALEMIFASNDSSNLVAVHSEEKAISDEYSPGMFTVEKIGGVDTYMEWKPIVYTKTSPGVSDSTRSKTSELLNITSAFKNNMTNDSMPYSLLQGLVGLTEPGATLVRVNITLGIPADGFYSSSSYQEWNCELGLGQPRIDGTSRNVKLIIGIGFGIPAALIVFGAIYVVYIRMKRRQASKLIQEPGSSYRTLD